ncbi:MAG: beta-lactamase family protein [Caldilineaceae bacterium]|nr:beta-lactamase family protein [Caldilineaceae bacterium]
MSTRKILPRSTPAAQGIPAEAITNFVKAAEQQLDALHSFLLLRHGQVVAEGWWSPYGPTEPHMLFSLSKSFTATAIGLAVAEGRLSVQDRVIDFFPTETPAVVSEYLAAMQVHHLLSMGTGHTEDTTRYLHEDPEGNWVKAFLARPVEREPGTHFLYNTGATYMLSAILQKLTGITLLDYLRPRLLDPLGIGPATWESCPRGINTGGYGLMVTTEDIARFGQLYLQQGQWQGQQLVPAAWIEQATTTQISNGDNPASDWAQGYGYQFWRCRHGAYRGDGAFGQYCIVMPAQDAVLAITSGLPDMQAVLNLVWQHLLPAMSAAPLPEDRRAQTALTEKLGSLALTPIQDAFISPLTSQVQGKTYQFPLAEQSADPRTPKTEAITFDFAAPTPIVTLRDTAGTHRLRVGNGEWIKGEMTVPYRGPQPVAVSGAWTATDTYTLRIYFYQTPFCTTITCQFAADQLFYNARLNVSFGPTQQPQLVGQAN